MMGLAAGLLAGALAPAKAQTKKKKQVEHARRETNASRQARIQRTIDDTYSHRYEVIGGGGYLRFSSGDYTKKNNEISWATALNYYLGPKFALVGDARGSFGRAHQEQGPDGIGLQYPQIPRPQINEYMFMGGGSYRFYAKEKLALSAQALGGIGWGIFSGGGKGLTGPQLGLWQDGTRPAFSVGVSADYNVQPNLALRFTPTYVATDFIGVNGSKIQNNIGFNVGVVYRFGHR
jgi:opacity protein-like surface antigen